MLKYEWPERFNYTLPIVDKIYTAVKNAVGLYNCYDIQITGNQSRMISIDQPASAFESALEDGRITVLTPLKRAVVEKPKKSISIDVSAAHAAAKFDVANNPYKPNSSVPEVEREINLMIRKVYDQAMKQEEFEYLSTGTASYTVVFHPEDKNYGTITVLVQPNVGGGYYDDAAEYLEQVGA